MQKPYTITLDLYSTGSKSTAINYVVSDSETMPLYIALTEKGKSFVIPQNAQVELNFRNSKGDTFPRYGGILDYETGRIMYEIDSADIAIAGQMTATVSLVYGGQRLTWPCFMFNVTRSLAGGAIPPEVESPWFTQIMGQLSIINERLDELEAGGGGGEGGTTYHDKLKNLAFAVSGHTGFASAAQVSAINSEITAINNRINALVLNDSALAEEILALQESLNNIQLIPGPQGEQGNDGYSPTVTVKTNTEDTYILEITYKDSQGGIYTYVTPNLLAGGVPAGGFLPLSTEIDPNWENWAAGSMFAFGFPDKTIVKIYNMLQGGTLYNEGMYVSQCGPNSRWNVSTHFPNGGHCFEGWSVDRKYRLTCIVLERNTSKITGGGNSDFEPDGLARVAVQVFDYANQVFGWTKIGSDSKYDYMGGWDFTDTWCKAHTPVTFRAMDPPTAMPGKNAGKTIPVPNGTMYFGKDNRLHLNADGEDKILAFVDDIVGGGVNKSQLINVINSALENLDSVLVSEDGLDVPVNAKYVTQTVYNAYSLAISDAQGIYADANATQEDVDGAVATLQIATTVFNDAKQDGKDATVNSITITTHSDSNETLEGPGANFGQPKASAYSYGYTDYIPAKIGDTVTVSAFLANSDSAMNIWCYDSDSNCLCVVSANNGGVSRLSANVTSGTNMAYYDFSYTLPDDVKITNCTKIRVVAHKYSWINMALHPFYVKVTYA